MQVGRGGLLQARQYNRDELRTENRELIVLTTDHGNTPPDRTRCRGLPPASPRSAGTGAAGLHGLGCRTSRDAVGIHQETPGELLRQFCSLRVYRPSIDWHGWIFSPTGREDPSSWRGFGCVRLGGVPREKDR